MDSSKLKLLVHTLKYLRFKQVYYRLFYFVRNRFFRKDESKPLNKTVEPIVWNEHVHYPNSFLGGRQFRFLNLDKTFDTEIDWNCNDFGKLWTYNLNYFDFLNQEEMSVEQGRTLIEAYIDKDNILKDGKEPYPISLRGINWVKFLSKNKVKEAQIDQTLYNHYQILLHNLEYHLLGNHLLENGYSLFFGAYYFKDETLYQKAKQILFSELKEQVLKDGAHFELSPMYHQILLHRLLDCITLAQLNPWKEDNTLDFLKEKAINMLSWLQTMTFDNGNIPMVNDAAYGIAPSSHQLLNYAQSIGLRWSPSVLSDSGYRKFSGKQYELLADVGNVGPTYQPGHAHADTLSFVLHKEQKPLIVDTGTSTYEKNVLRQQERATAAHNTVKIGDIEQTQVWGGFRVAKRAEITALKEDENALTATHDGYKNQGTLHTRNFFCKDNSIWIDDVLSKKGTKAVAHFHFHSNIKEVQVQKEGIKLPEQGVKISFSSNEEIQIEKETYQLAAGFNNTQKAIKIKVYFCEALQTQIDL